MTEETKTDKQPTTTAANEGEKKPAAAPADSKVGGGTTININARGDDKGETKAPAKAASDDKAKESGQSLGSLAWNLLKLAASAALAVSAITGLTK